MAEQRGAGMGPLECAAGSELSGLSGSTEFEYRLEQAKLDALKELAYGASHEINNPLANIAARAQTLLVDEKDAERRRKLLAIHRQAMRAHEMIADLMLFARPPKLHVAPCDLQRVAANVLEELRDEAAERQIELHSDGPLGELTILADETQLAVALKALVANAIEAVGSSGNVWVEARTCEAIESGRRDVQMVVRDDGPGVPESIRAHLFDPFFSGREAGRGLGFGLSKCWRIVTDHGGQVYVANVPGGGAQFTILLPSGGDSAT